MDQAYCPYCGKAITVRGQACCPHCSADIIEIWKLLNSNLQPPSPVRPAPSQPPPLDWLVPVLIIGLGLVLFILVVVGIFYALPWLSDLVGGFATRGLNLLPAAAGFSSPLNVLG